MRKSLSRIASVQVIYNLELLKNLQAYKSLSEEELKIKIEQAIANSKDFLQDNELGKLGIKLATPFSYKIVSGVIEFNDQIDKNITSNIAEGWSFASVPPLLKAILRCSTFEILAEKETSTALILSEYLRITDEFFDRDEASFVNACIDRIAKENRSS